MPAARRSGKTEISKRALVRALFARAGYGGRGRFFAGAPTNDQAKAIWWEDLKKLIPWKYIKKIIETTMEIHAVNGNMLKVVGLDKPQRIEGTIWDGGIIDEFANAPVLTYQNHIRPLLSTIGRPGWLWLIGVPDMDSPGQVEYKKLYDYARMKVDPEWDTFNWPASDIIDPKEVEAAKRTMDERVFRQEYMGEFLLTGGLAFPDFTREVNVRDDFAVYDKSLGLCWTLDFNVNPMCSLVIQHHGGTARVVEEISIPDTTTRMAVLNFLDRSRKSGWNLADMCVYGDPAGNARSTKSARPGETDWIIVRNELSRAGIQFRMKVARDHSAIADTRNAVNALVKNAAGESRLYLNSKCTNLIKDFESLLWPSDLSEGHSMASLRYFCDWEFPVRSTGPAEVGQFAVL